MTTRRQDDRLAGPWLLATALGFILLFAAVPVVAEEDEPDASTEESSKSIFDFRGYGTLGVLHSSERQADYLGGLFISNGAGHSASWSPEVDSVVGAQLTATFTQRLSAVVQMTAAQSSDGSYTPRLEWANLNYRLTPDVSVRLGRIVLASFLVADSRKLGYANSWVRPPVEVYGMVPVTSSDGIDVSYRLHSGDYTHTFLANYGQTEEDIPDGTKVEARNIRGLTVTTERGAATLQARYTASNLTIDGLNTLFDQFRQFGPEGVALAERYDVDGGTYEFISLGARYDPGTWFLMAEWGTAHGASVLGGRTAWYVSGGYRFGTLTPYLAYATTKADTNRSDPGLTAAAYPGELAGAILALNGALNQALAENPLQETLSAGLRWDFRANLDVKLQFGHSRLGADSHGSLGNLQPGFRSGGSYDLISLAVDFVF